jgi:hypothetical protein
MVKCLKTYGAELQTVRQYDDAHIWTVHSSDDDDGEPVTYLSSGYHIVDRLGYIVCKKPYYGEPVFIDMDDYV